MKESSSIFSTISSLFKERQGLEKSERRAAKRRWKRRKISIQEGQEDSSRMEGLSPISGRIQERTNSFLSSRFDERSFLTGSGNLPREAGQLFQSRKR
jgi:hypothetical protein